MSIGGPVDRQKAISAMTMAFLIVSVSFSCMVGVEGKEAGEGYDDSLDSMGKVLTAPDGSVESYNSPIEPTTSMMDDVVPHSYMTREPDGICYWTPYGVYIFNESRPEKMSLISLNGTKLVEESFFTVMTKGAPLEILEGKVVTAVDERLEVAYSLRDASSEAIWDMTTIYEFETGTRPKITASIPSHGSETKDWNIAWIIVPGENAEVDRIDDRWTGASLKDMAKDESSSFSSSLDLDISLDVRSERLTIDWSDAGEGALSVAQYDGNDYARYSGREEIGPGSERTSLVVSFRKGEGMIDPTVVGPTTNAEATGFACQRKMFWNDGLYWLFYNSGTAICYRYSADGITWSGQIPLPHGTTPHSNSGFDVAFKNGEVMVGWRDLSTTVYAIKGTVIGTAIQWMDKVFIDEGDSEYYVLDVPVSVAIGGNTRGLYYIAYSIVFEEGTCTVVRMSTTFERDSFGSTGPFSIWQEYGFNRIAILLPFSKGSMALIETGYRYSSTNRDGYIWISYYLEGVGTWTESCVYDIGLSNGNSPYFKSERFSASASSDGTVHISYMGTDSKLKYASIRLDGTVSITTIHDQGCCPTICLDSNNILHVSYFYNEYLGQSTYSRLRHAQKPLSSGPWSDELLLSFEGPNLPAALTSLEGPIGSLSVAWTMREASGSTSVQYASVPMPYGTPGHSSDPWDRSGLSPYGTYFAMNGQYISPGSGQLSIVQQDVSVPGRGGLDLEISRIYQQPKYFMHNAPYDYKVFPFCNLGQYWSLDLPWMDDYYLYLANGQRFVVQWGNDGNSKEFVNHDGVHFVLREVNKQGTQYYELITSSGMRYQFDHSSPFALRKISDLVNYDPEAVSYTEPHNCLTLAYSGNRLISITDSGLGRTVSFSYNADGMLSGMTRPDGEAIHYAYTQYNRKWYLTSVTDADDRVTTFTYDPSANYCLSAITYPSSGKVQYAYGIDQSPATEVVSRLVTSESIRDSHTNALMRQTSFDYKIINGKVSYCKLTNYDETGVAQGSNAYTFRSAMKSSSEIVLGPTGEQMQKKVTWYDTRGQPTRVDTYSGSSAEVSHSEYMAYDGWGNVIFTRDALGHGSYYSYANTNIQNSFQGGTVLERTSSGKIFHDSFDDWDCSDWSVEVGAGNVQLDSVADPTRAPSVKLSRTKTSGSLYAAHQFDDQSGNFNIQTSFRAQDKNPNYISVMSGAAARINFQSADGYFKYYSGSTWVSVASYASETWYDIGFVVRYSSNAYDIYINGTLVKINAPLMGSGPLNSVRFQANSDGGSNTALWFDDVRIYRSNIVTVGGLRAGDIVELYDSQGKLLDRSKSGTLNVPAFARLSLPAYIKLLRTGDTPTSTPMMDIWGGDAYSISEGSFIAAIKEHSSGYAQSWSSIADDDWPSGSILYSFNYEYRWITDSDGAVTGDRYRQSRDPSQFGISNQGHGFRSATSYLTVSHSSDAIVQYIWMEHGEIPREIVLQYFVNGVWKRAYWGGDAAGNDEYIIAVPPELRPLSQNVHRIGDVPLTTGQWVQLVVKASDLGIPDSSKIYGIIYGVRGATVKWDYSGVHSLGIGVDGLSPGMIVKMKLENGATISKTATSGSVMLDLYSQGIRTFPISASFEVYSNSGGSLIYASPVYDEIFNYDMFRYSGTNFYPNSIKSDLHNSLVGSLTYQDHGNTIAQESYVDYNWDGHPVATKSKLGTSWTYARYTYDQYGNPVSSTDATGVMSYHRYGHSGTYLIQTGLASSSGVPAGSITEDFESSTGWQPYSYRSWLTSSFTTERYTSASHSVKLTSTGGGADGQDHGLTSMSKDFEIDEISEVSLRMYVAAYSHNGSPWDWLESGIRLRLCDTSGNNYATYTYWLACWTQGQDSRTTTDPNTKVIYGKPTMNTWLNVVLHPSDDWSIDWSLCDKVGFELFTAQGGSNGDRFTVYYDDLIVEGGHILQERGQTSYSYDLGTGQVLSVTDACGAVTSYRYDVLGRNIETINPDGTSVSIDYDDDNNRATTYDELGRRTVSYYDVIGRLVKVENYGLSSTPYSRVTYAYNWQDLPIRVVDEMGRVTEYTYDYLGRLTSTINRDGTTGEITEDFESSTGWQPYSHRSWLTSSFTTERYTSASHSVKIHSSGGGGDGQDYGSTSMSKDFDINEISDISLRMYIGAYSHDGRDWDRLESGIRIQLYDPSGSNYATYTYWLACWNLGQDNKTTSDPNVKVIHGKPTMNTWLNVVLHPSEDWDIDWSRCDKVRLELYVDQGGSNRDSFTVYYDDLSIGYAGSISTSFTEYDDTNRLVNYIDELGHRKEMKYDELGRLSATREYHSSSEYYETLMTYDAVGNLNAVRQANGEVTRMYYDTLGRQTSILYPDGLSESWTYDNAGRILTSTSRNGQVTTSSYDAFGDLVSVSSADDIIATSYDDKGRIIEKSNGLGSITYQYDVMDRVIDMIEAINGASFHFSYGYDAAGGLLYVDYPDSGRVSYIYDDLGRLMNVVSNGQQLLHLTYNLDGSVATETYGGGNSVVSYAYNERGWVRGIFAEDRYGTDLLGLRYTYDAAGNVVSIEDDIGSAGTENYWYDALGRLKKATGAWGAIQYGYDAVGNRLWKNENGNNVSYSYEAYNQLSYDGTWGYEHDDDGNIVWKEASNLKYNYVYDALGRMTSVVKHELLGSWVATTIGEYSYDANGARAMVVDSSGTSRFVYSGHDPVYEVSSDGSTNKYIYANGRLAMRIVNGIENDCYISDALGSTRLVLKNGNAGSQDIMFSAVTYKPFGAVYSPSGSDQVTFAGEMVDDTGLVYLFARYYDSEIGRFYALDPELGDLSSPQTMNRFVYCHNNPIAYKDPTGKFGIIGALIGGAIGATANVLISAATGNLHSWEDVSKAAVVGGVSGAIAGATCGLGLGIGAVGGLIAGMAGETTNQLLDGKKFNDLDATSILISGAIGAAFGGLGELAPALKADSFKQAISNMKNVKLVNLKPMLPYAKVGPIREFSIPYIDMIGAPSYLAGGKGALVQLATDSALSSAWSGLDWGYKQARSVVADPMAAIALNPTTIEVRSFLNSAPSRG